MKQSTGSEAPAAGDNAAQQHAVFIRAKCHLHIKGETKLAMKVFLGGTDTTFLTFNPGSLGKTFHETAWGQCD